MNAPGVLLSRPPCTGERDVEEGLDALLELLAEPPEPDRTRARRMPAHRADAPLGAGLRRWALTCVRSAAGWGAGPQGAWRAW